MSDPVGGAPPGPPGEPRLPDAAAHLRLPWPLVAGALVGVLAIALVAGVYANRNLRPQPVAVAAAATPTPLPAASTPVQPTRAPTPVPDTAPPQALPTPAPVVTVAITPLIVGTLAPRPNNGPQPVLPTPPASAPPAPSILPTVDPLLVAELSRVYERYWQVRSQALFDLDKSHLDEVMAGEHLGSIAKRVDELIAEKRAIKTDVDHQYQVVQADNDTAHIFDDYISNSFYVDPVSHEPLSEPGADELQVLYEVRKLNGDWKVVDSVRAE